MGWVIPGTVAKVGLLPELASEGALMGRCDMTCIPQEHFVSS